MGFLKKQTGFTLLEVLIAVAIFALVSAATFSMLQQTLTSGEVFDRKITAVNNLKYTYRVIQEDISQIVSRPIRDEFGDSSPMLLSEEMDWGVGIELTRTGRRNPLAKPRSNMQRVRYYFNGKSLVRRTWKNLDRAPGANFTDRIILNNVASWQVQFLSDNGWLDEWPVETTPQGLPQAIEFKLSLRDETTFRWLFSVKPPMNKGEL